MYVYPEPSFRAVAPAPEAGLQAMADNAPQDADAKLSDTSLLLRGFAFEEDARIPVKKPAPSLQELGRLAASASPYENVDTHLKTKMKRDLSTAADSVFILSPDGRSYQEPVAEKGWLSLDKLLLAEQDAQQKKQHFRAQAEAIGISKKDRKNTLRQLEKVASDDCSKYAKIREIFGNGNGKYHPNQLVAKKYMPAQGLCEKELLYKFALKISNLQELYQKKKLAMDPYDFYRWVICKNLKSDLHNALNNTRHGLTGLIRSMGDDSGQADQVFRAIVLYWASLTGNENKFGRHRKVSRARNRRSMPELETSRAKVGLGGRDLALRISRFEMRRRNCRDQAKPANVFAGVNAFRAQKSLAPADSQ